MGGMGAGDIKSTTPSRVRHEVWSFQCSSSLESMRSLTVIIDGVDCCRSCLSRRCGVGGGHRTYLSGLSTQVIKCLGYVSSDSDNPAGRSSTASDRATAELKIEKTTALNNKTPPTYDNLPSPYQTTDNCRTKMDKG